MRDPVTSSQLGHRVLLFVVVVAGASVFAFGVWVLMLHLGWTAAPERDTPKYASPEEAFEAQKAATLAKDWATQFSTFTPDASR